jgi:predicted unusual protein kinase regulating ubiquinone biosynthesis (AarF/ABC1/UbiB family)
MDFVKGTTLKEALKEIENGRVDKNKIKQVRNAIIDLQKITLFRLLYDNDNCKVHGDIKLGNIMINLQSNNVETTIIDCGKMFSFKKTTRNNFHQYLDVIKKLYDAYKAYKDDLKKGDFFFQSSYFKK